MPRYLFTLPLMLCLVAVAPVAAHSYSADELLRNGQQAWTNVECVRAARFLFAYSLTNSPALQNPEHLNAVQRAIDWCEQNSQVFADVKGDKQGKPGSPPPQLNLTPQPSSHTNARCDIYARIAVAQNEAATTNNCNVAGGRWNSNYQYHYQWCLSVPGSSTTEDTTQRQYILTKCAP
jgi:hypothetical protein